MWGEGEGGGLGSAGEGDLEMVRIRVRVRVRVRVRASDDELLVLAARLLRAGRHLLREHQEVVRRSEW